MCCCAESMRHSLTSQTTFQIPVVPVKLLNVRLRVFACFVSHWIVFFLSAQGGHIVSGFSTRLAAE